MNSIKISKIIEWAKSEGFSLEFEGNSESEVENFSSLKNSI